MTHSQKNSPALGCSIRKKNKMLHDTPKPVRQHTCMQKHETTHENLPPSEVAGPEANMNATCITHPTLDNKRPCSRSVLRTVHEPTPKSCDTMPQSNLNPCVCNHTCSVKRARVGIRAATCVTQVRHTQLHITVF